MAGRVELRIIKLDQSLIVHKKKIYFISMFYLQVLLHKHIYRNGFKAVSTGKPKHFLLFASKGQPLCSSLETCNVFFFRTIKLMVHLLPTQNKTAKDHNTVKFIE